MSFLGTTVRVDGNTAKLAGGQATWAYAAEKAATATFNVQNAAGELVYSENRTISAGSQTFNWNGRASDGHTLPDGDYKVSILAKDASGQSVAVSTEVEGVVDGIDVSKSPPVLSVGGQNFTVDKIKQVRRPGA
jgi:flagellar basal-body rod modification protein FlgD